MIESGYCVDDSKHDGRFHPVIHHVKVGQAHCRQKKKSDLHATDLNQNIHLMCVREELLTHCPVRQVLQQLHVGGDGEDVHEMEEHVHHKDDSQVNHALHTDVPHLPLFSGQV